MFNLSSKKSNKQVIEKIHHEFNSAGDALLAEVNELINGNSALLKKAERLEMAGFKMANEVERASKILLDKKTADFVVYYRERYPFNKFITELQVNSINSKYGLVCCPIKRYKGFVPESKLSIIESFIVKPEDKEEKKIKVTKWSHIDNSEQARLNEKYPDFIFPYSMFYAPVPLVNINGSNIFISKYEILDSDSLYICAPAKDMDISGLKQVGNKLMSFTKIEVPDPVVLQPVKGGYLIVTAWGDEASDEIVVNQISN